MIALALSLVLNGPSAGAVDHPCEQIKAACEQQGFVKGEHKTGHGLWQDCIEVVLGIAPPPKNLARPLPTIAPELIAECKAKHGGMDAPAKPKVH